MRSRRSRCARTTKCSDSRASVLVEAPNLDRAAGASAGGEEPMAVRDGAGLDLLHPRAECAAARPIVNGTTRPPYRNSSHRIGRPKTIHRVRPRDGRPSSSASGTRDRAAAPPGCPAAHRPRSGRAVASGTRDIPPSASAARVSCSNSHSLLLRESERGRRRLAIGATPPTLGDPVIVSSRSSWRSAIFAMRAVSRRGVRSSRPAAPGAMRTP